MHFELSASNEGLNVRSHELNRLLDGENLGQTTVSCFQKSGDADGKKNICGRL